jgi:hypothetical protein
VALPCFVQIADIARNKLVDLHKWRLTKINSKKVYVYGIGESLYDGKVINYGKRFI